MLSCGLCITHTCIYYTYVYHILHVYVQYIHEVVYVLDGLLVVFGDVVCVHEHVHVNTVKAGLQYDVGSSVAVEFQAVWDAFMMLHWPVHNITSLWCQLLNIVPIVDFVAWTWIVAS